ncbi:At5g01610-like protein [Dioscorea alata]|uniref:Uncharacterized protein LOC120261922 n=2 Tax=Dioscorea TaxID=4672 RepID=A0AB40BFY0_DIOCR|nr:uncharacterized protein LOC120261922 [Dioscorea cayenensis subsp. rotundata]KAH7682277.1 At5g01610-like protein [Dioscorea alata]
MATQLIESNRDGAEVYHGADLCKKKCIEVLEEMHLPRGLLPLNNLEEVGRNKATGFVWLRQPKSVKHDFDKIGRPVSYATEVTAFLEDRRMKRVSGVKSKEMLIWVSLCDIFINDADGDKITFKTPTGLSRSFPVSAFELEETKN